MNVLLALMIFMIVCLCAALAGSYRKTKALEESIYATANALSNHKSGDRHAKLPETIDCHTCGCMVKKENAVKGESRIEKIEIGNWPPMFPKHLIPTEERIVNDWYCKRCAPKHEPLTCATTTTAMAGSVGSTPTTTAPVQSADAETKE